AQRECRWEHAGALRRRRGHQDVGSRERRVCADAAARPALRAPRYERSEGLDRGAEDDVARVGGDGERSCARYPARTLTVPGHRSRGCGCRWPRSFADSCARSSPRKISPVSLFGMSSTISTWRGYWCLSIRSLQKAMISFGVAEAPGMSVTKALIAWPR